MTEQEQKITDLKTPELPQSESANKHYIASLVSMTDSTARISLKGNDSEKKVQLKKELEEVSVVFESSEVS
tara:strand:- start:940 stop:1152 length:213 start_codon:yes stop_codon:yes gene_type:complete